MLQYELKKIICKNSVINKNKKLRFIFSTQSLYQKVVNHHAIKTFITEANYSR